MKKTNIVFAFTLLLLASACGKKTSDPTGGALPLDWLAVTRTQRVEKTDADSSTPTPPSIETDKQIQAVFQAQSQSLDRFSQSEKIGDSFRLLHGGPGGEPGEAPWHLSNFVASFGVSVEGIFGKLISGGSAAAKGIWARKDLKSKISQRKTDRTLNSLNTHSIAWSTQTSRKLQLEPVVRMAMNSATIQNESNFRENLNQVAARFDHMARLLEIGGPTSSWQVSRFALLVHFDASGMVSPAITVGGNFGVRLDWDRPLKNTGIRLASLTEEQTRFLRLIQTLGTEIGAAEAETQPMKNLNFKLDHLHLALGLTIEGTLGVVGLGGSVEGILYYSRPGEGETFQMQGMDPQTIHSRLEIPVLKSNIAAFNDSDSIQVIDPRQFRKGIKRALKMGRYFAEAAMSTQGDTWELDEIETEFGIGLGGNFGVVTVEGEAHVALEFGYEGENQ